MLRKRISPPQPQGENDRNMRPNSVSFSYHIGLFKVYLVSFNGPVYTILIEVVSKLGTFSFFPFPNLSVFSDSFALNYRVTKY